MFDVQNFTLSSLSAVMDESELAVHLVSLLISHRKEHRSRGLYRSHVVSAAVMLLIRVSFFCLLLVCVCVCVCGAGESLN